MSLILHPKSGVSVQGICLSSGATLSEDDVFASSDGTWQPCPCVGVTLCTDKVAWVRLKELSREAQLLLRYLAATQSVGFARPLHSTGGWAVMRSFDERWDSRIQYRYVQHPAALDELVGFGFLVCESKRSLDILRLMPAGERIGNEIYASLH